MENKNNLGAYLWIMGILVVLVVGMIGANAMVNQRAGQKETKKEETNGATPTPDLMFRGEIMAPVTEKLLVPIYPGEPVMSNLVLKLPLGTDIKAGINGQIRGVGPGPEGDGTNIQILDGKSSTVVSYLFTGVAKVKDGQRAVAGETIGTIGEGKAPSCLSDGNFGLYISDQINGLTFSLDQLREPVAE